MSDTPKWAIVLLIISVGIACASIDYVIHKSNECASAGLVAVKPLWWGWGIKCASIAEKEQK